MTKAKTAKSPAKPRAPKETARISYHPGANAQSAEIALPVKPGHGERLINEAEKAGADVAHVRAQVGKLPHA